jgi:ABC-type uncharacterized transport system substrate-binding protein
MGGDPVHAGVVTSLNRPNGNLTGITFLTEGLETKRLGILRELLPKAVVIGVLIDPNFSAVQQQTKDVEQAAGALGVRPAIFRPTSENDFGQIFEELSRQRADALLVCASPLANNTEIDQAITALKLDGATTIIVQPSPFTYRERSHIVGTASDNGLATIFGFPAAARDGALIAYGPDYLHMNQRAPLYVAQILKGTKPADLPVELPAKINLVVNLKTAKRLGMEVPLPLLIRADELIE